MVRVSDARMSGTAYGTVVLQWSRRAPRAARWRWSATATRSCWTCRARRLDIDLPAAELARREPAAAMTAALPVRTRGWERLYIDHVMQADRGADLDFLVGASGHEVTRDSH